MSSCTCVECDLLFLLLVVTPAEVQPMTYTFDVKKNQNQKIMANVTIDRLFDKCT